MKEKCKTFEKTGCDSVVKLFKNVLSALKPERSHDVVEGQKLVPGMRVRRTAPPKCTTAPTDTEEQRPQTTSPLHASTCGEGITLEH